MDRFKEVIDSAERIFGNNGKLKLDVKENYIWVSAKEQYMPYGTEIFYNPDADAVDVIAHGKKTTEAEFIEDVQSRLFVTSLKSRRF